MIENDRFEQALEESIKSSEYASDLKVYSYQVSFIESILNFFQQNLFLFLKKKSIVLKYIEFLIISKRYIEAADYCNKKTLNKTEWEEKIIIFIENKQLQVSM